MCVWEPVMGDVFRQSIDDNQSHVTVTLLLPWPDRRMDGLPLFSSFQNQKLRTGLGLILDWTA